MIRSGEVTAGRTPSGEAHRCWSITLGLVVVQDLLEAISAQEAILRRARGWAANHASGKSSASEVDPIVQTKERRSFATLPSAIRDA
jgi:hypothetical protein